MLQRYEYIPSARQIVSCLTSEYQWLNLIKNQNKEYNPILDYLLLLGKEKECEDCSYDLKKYQSNTISKITGIPTSKIKKLLINIYEDIFQLNYSSPDLFKNGNPYFYELSFSSRSLFSFFKLWLPVPLSPFDLFDFYFMKAKLRIDFFWVEEISHRQEYGKTITTASLKGGFSNKYRELLLAKAEFMNKISIKEKYDLSDYQLDDILKLYAEREKL